MLVDPWRRSARSAEAEAAAAAAAARAANLDMGGAVEDEAEPGEEEEQEDELSPERSFAPAAAGGFARALETPEPGQVDEDQAMEEATRDTAMREAAEMAEGLEAERAAAHGGALDGTGAWLGAGGGGGEAGGSGALGATASGSVTIEVEEEVVEGGYDDDDFESESGSEAPANDGALQDGIIDDDEIMEEL